MKDLVSREAVLALAKDIRIPVENGVEYRHRCIDPQDVIDLPSVQETFTGATGWICPVCGAGLSPFTSMCPCGGNKWKLTTRSSTSML